LRNVAKFHVAPVEVQLVGHLIARKEYVGFLVAVEIAHADAPAVVDILVVENVERVAFGDRVGERNTRVRRAKPLKQWFLVAAGQQENKRDQQKPAAGSMNCHKQKRSYGVA